MAPGTYDDSVFDTDTESASETDRAVGDEPIDVESMYDSEVDELYKCAKEFVKLYTSGRRHVALKESLPRLCTALKEAKPLFEE